MSSVGQVLIDPLNLRENIFGGNQEQPNLTTYGGGMKEALETQLALLTGKKVGDADFTSVGSLEDLLPIEQSLREKSAQVDTDVLRQTLLGGTTGGGQQEVTYDDQGRIEIGREEAPSYEIKQSVQNKKFIEGSGDKYVDGFDPKSPFNKVRLEFYSPEGKMLTFIEHTPYLDPNNNQGKDRASYDLKSLSTQLNEKIQKLEDVPDNVKSQINTNIESSGYYTGSAENKDSKSFRTEAGEGAPIYAKDDQGNIIQDTSKAGTTEVTTLPTQRTGDGVVDLLGDRRNVLDTRKLSKSEQAIQLIEQNPELQALYDFAQNDPGNPLGGLTKEQAGRTLLSQYENTDAMAEALGISSIDLPDYDQVDTGRQAGFDESGNFLGLAAYSEDLAAGNLSRQRERDLLDVARLSGTYQDIMKDYKPGTQQALADARDVLASQKDTLTGAGAITVPTDSTFAGVEDVNVADPLLLKANTQFDQELARSGDSLRSDILGDARTALKEGLTPREERQIAEAARARSTLMGRTFDQSGAIAEAEARVAEDNARRMQNRAFAQSVLGQEAGLQQGDITRGMAQESEQAGLQQRRDLVQADVDLRSALANQAQQQQAKQFGVGATMDAERLNEQLRQQGTLGYLQAAGNLASLEDRTTLEPFRAVLGRGGGQSLQTGQSVLGTAGYGLGSGPQFINPESGLGFIQGQNTNLMNIYNAQNQADAERFSGLTSAAATAALAACWVAREVYGVHNPAWLAFRYWMLNESPSWFRTLYLKFGKRFAEFISNKPRLKARIRKWMDSKIGR